MPPLHPLDPVQEASDSTAPGQADSFQTRSNVPPDGRGAVQAPAASGLPSWAPARLGGYRLTRELGHGGMGYVFEAEDDKLRRRVAVKVLHPEVARHADAADRFLREARAAAAIEHDNVVPVLHVGEEGGMPFIVLPLLQGESLDKRLKREQPLPAAAVARIGRDVAAALTAAHARGLVHRDLKPANVWLDDNTGRARVLDFGLARLSDGADALTQTGALVGTPAYMAPEQIDGQPPGPRADLFSLGATLYECAAGRKAFHGPTVTAILKAVAEHQPPPPAQLNPKAPAPLSDLIMRLLAKDAAQRPASATEVEAAFAGLASAGDSTIAMERHVGPRRLRPRLLMGGALAAVFLVAGGVWLASRPPDGTGPAPSPKKKEVAPAPVRYRGKVDVLVERPQGLLRLNQPGALPLKASDRFSIAGEVDPPAYLYVVWVDPGGDVTPVYPWDAKIGWGSRPATEAAVDKVRLPSNVGMRYTAPKAKPGGATIVLLARSSPLEASDEEIKSWFESLPDVPLPPGGDAAAVWFDDFMEVRDPLRLRTFGEVGSDDAFARWQGALQKALGGRFHFQTAVSFARTGAK